MAINALPMNPALIYAPSGPPDPGAAALGGGASLQSSQRFEGYLKEGLHAVNDAQLEANAQTEEMITSQGANLHEAMIALSRAEITLRLGVKVGQKLVSAYQELGRIQI